MSDAIRLDDAVMQQALAWHIRLRDADDAAWAEFTDWLELSPDHNAAYDQVALADADIGALLAQAEFPAAPVDQPLAANDDAPVTGAPAFWRWGALAASLVLGLFLATQMLMSGADPYTVTTAPGEQREIALADGGTVMLNGDSEIVLDHDNPRLAELLSGEAHFTVVHDASDPFVVTVGESRLVDVGTVFNVLRENEELTVEVSEGAVRYEGAETVDLAAGDALHQNADGSLSVATAAVETMGGWVDGMLVYENEYLFEVTSDIARAKGIEIIIAPELARQRFSGVIQIDGDSEVMRPRVADLLGVTIDSTTSGWTVHR